MVLEILTSGKSILTANTLLILTIQHSIVYIHYFRCMYTIQTSKGQVLSYKWVAVNSLLNISIFKLVCHVQSTYIIYLTNILYLQLIYYTSIISSASYFLTGARETWGLKQQQHCVCCLYVCLFIWTGYLFVWVFFFGGGYFFGGGLGGQGIIFLVTKID